MWGQRPRARPGFPGHPQAGSKDDVIEVQFLIPVADNAGVPFSPAHHDVFAAHLVSLFGAFTVLPGVASGQWADRGVTYADDLRVYLVAVGGLVADGPTVANAVAFAKAHCSQLAIYVRYLGVSEVL